MVLFLFNLESCSVSAVVSLQDFRVKLCAEVSLKAFMRHRPEAAISGNRLRVPTEAEVSLKTGDMMVPGLDGLGSVFGIILGLSAKADFSGLTASIWENISWAEEEF